ncbi:FHA [Musa troglodytarum]|uniref:FHA n=1 Tax=Musa troglodytarum TaxID=320322 RepID=A0A9E7G6Q6_9LILI|nr:FHA [Musa troglodytarum]
MVWCLYPVDPVRGAQKYYIFSIGTYKIGRKVRSRNYVGSNSSNANFAFKKAQNRPLFAIDAPLHLYCDVVVQTDTSISRVHAEIVLDKMISQDPSGSMISSGFSGVHIIDRSKFGTVVNKELGVEATRLKKNEEAMLKDGNFVTFGTGCATFRLSYVPFVIFSGSVNTSPLNPMIQATILAIGAYLTSSWSPECTHVLVEKSSPLSIELIQAVLARKPIILGDWFKMLAEKSICTEIPSCTSYVPDLVLDGTLVKVVEPMFREKIFEGYTFVLGSLNMYKFKGMFQSLLELVGAKCLSAGEFSSNSQTSTDGENNQLILVVPAESTGEFNHLRELSSLVRVIDVKLVAAVLSGNLDLSIFEQPSYVVSSSHSTDETIVAASDVEMDTATSDHADATAKPQLAINSEYEDVVKRRLEDGKGARRCENRENDIGSSAIASYGKVSDSRNEDVGLITRTEKGDESVDRHENSDIIYSQDLIVRNISTTYSQRSTTDEVFNFKCFRKAETVSGNSFKDLIPFSKDPYNESDFGSNGTLEYMKEEKKRKQIEAIAEDLFNNDKVRKRAAAGTSLYSLFNRK